MTENKTNMTDTEGHKFNPQGQTHTLGVGTKSLNPLPLNQSPQHPSKQKIYLRVPKLTINTPFISMVIRKKGKHSARLK